jgi:hypothetical protein
MTVHFSKRLREASQDLMVQKPGKEKPCWPPLFSMREQPLYQVSGSVKVSVPVSIGLVKYL